MTDPAIHLRAITREDSSLLFAWANDPHVRAASLSPDPISRNTHDEWFQKKLSDPACHMFIGMNGEESRVGQVRCDGGGGVAEVDVHTAPDHRGKGYGTLMIREVVRKLFAETGVKEVHAFIKPENEASIRAFTKAGFIEEGRMAKKGSTVFHFVILR